ncbi:L7Ae/L30e/S12e/Gadd45 family ribosomal protein [Peptostreptococcus canis]|uniref:50S ribosomal protein L7ae n=1 Tax=Peptostreptococcus canis TaxID=1159213 RepID=A0ABR6TM25_9FIRM|nr:ribosomal L7Ae/L30e/S12e/Gadd45 family protein [Peptostreptococcus canis]MBC2576472.1 50S ribosomal protein L7ae [Peptostreptococcus canis]MBP1998692.1 ribosomal protein L7Ae-like RNA K-turn-binding protein [Peptostreptococcus canis]
MDDKKIYSWLGLCMRSGNLVSGDDTTLRDVKKNKLSLVIIAEDASDNTKKLFKDKCSFRNIEYYFFGTKEKIGNSIGKSPRAVLGISDKNMAIQIVKLLSKE